MRNHRLFAVRQWLIVLPLLVLYPSCQPIPPITTCQVRSSFVLSDAEPYMQLGDGTIAGQAFMRTLGGEAKTAAGLKVELYPATPYFAERYSCWGDDARGNPISPQPAIPEEAQRFIRSTVCDASGNFEFTGLPPGEYLLRCYIRWLLTTYPNAQYSGGTVKGRVAVREGESVRIMLTR